MLGARTFFLVLFLGSFAFERTRASTLDRVKKQLSALLLNKEEPVTSTYGQLEEEEEEGNFVTTTSSMKRIGNDRDVQGGNDDSSSLTISLLMDIRDLLFKEKEEKNELSTQKEDQQQHNRLEDMAQQAQISVSSMAEDLTRYRASTDEKINLVLETFATLKLLVVNQGNQLQEALARLETLEGRAHRLESQMPLEETRTTERLSGYRPGFVEASGGSGNTPTGVTIMNNKIVDLTRTVNTLQKDVRNLKGNVTELVALSQVITIHEKPAPSSARPPAGVQDEHQPSPGAPDEQQPSPAVQDEQKCQCNLEDIEDSIRKVQKEQESMRIFASELGQNLTVLQGQEKQRLDSIFTNRLGEVEGSIRDLNAVRREVTAVKEGLNTLREEMGAASEVKDVFGTSLVTLGSKGLCVWPYSRCGESCFFIQSNKRLNWKAARDYCRSIQGDLAAPASFDDLRNFIGNQRLSRAYSYWLGASDIDIEGVWTWVNGQPLSQNSTLWALDSPGVNILSNCLSFKPNNRYEIFATDEECRISRYFICEQERLV
ncbi:CD209 antigen-like [Palaemon carinicauda]|uniref:CD209 antigen-like n=1 Tax=Palaemon carinicauda TaxID=392227 RepID=UPI0035B5A0C8